MDFVQPIKEKTKIESMKKVLKSDRLRDYVLFVLGINSGLRISDLLALHVKDVTDDAKDLKIRDRIVVKESKTGKTKDFPVGLSARKAIKEYLSKVDLSPSSPLFPSRKGTKAIGREQAYRILNKAAKTVGIKDKIGTHTLRKTFAYHAYQSGHDLSLIQKLLNHSAPSVTLRYIGITQEEMDDVYMNLNL